MTSPQGPTPLSPAIVEEALRFAGLEPNQSGFLTEYFDRDPADWCDCCGNACDPCVLQILRAVDKARELLGLEPRPGR